MPDAVTPMPLVPGLRFTALVALIGPLCGVAGQETSPPIIRAETRRVLLRVVVREPHSRKPVTGFTESDFVLTDSGRPQPLTYFAAPNDTGHPIALALLVDLEALHARALRQLAASAGSALKQLHPRDQIAVWRMNQKTTEEIQPPSSDHAVSLRTLQNLAEQRQQLANWGTGPVKAIQSILDSLHEFQRDADPTLVVLTNDIDAETIAKVEALRKGLLRAQVTMHLLDSIHGSDRFLRAVEDAVAPGGRSPTVPFLHYRFLGYLVHQTGGEFVEVHHEDYGKALEELFRDIAASYTMEFAPAAADGKFHTVEVTIRRGARVNPLALKVFARKGYFAEAASPARR